MQRYIRLAGIEIQGAIEILKVLPPADIMAQVVNLFTKEAVLVQIGLTRIESFRASITIRE